MYEIVVDAATGEKVLAAGVVVVKDETGRVLGRLRRSTAHITDDPYDLGMSEEELLRLVEAGERTYTTAEVLEYVKGLVK